MAEWRETTGETKEIYIAADIGCRNADGQMLPGTGLKNTQFSGVGNEHTSHLCTGNSPVYATDCFLEEFRDMLSPHHGNNAANFRNGHDTTEAINKTAAATAIVVLLGLLGQTRKENFVEIINIGHGSCTRLNRP